MSSFRRNLSPLRAGLLLLLALAAASCDRMSATMGKHNVQPFSYVVSLGEHQFQIEGYLALSAGEGRRPALLVMNAGAGNARRCVDESERLTDLGIHVACLSIPGYGKSSGPSRFVGPQSVAAARRALDLLAQRSDVDPSRLGVWGSANGAVAAGLVMDADPRVRAVVLESGAYDLLNLWPEAPWMTKLAILHEVWPSRRVLKERSVIEHLPEKLDCNVLILHGGRDARMPIRQARRLEQALKQRGAHVEARYFPTAPHLLGDRVRQPIEDFLRENLIASN